MIHPDAFDPALTPTSERVNALRVRLLLGTDRAGALPASPREVLHHAALLTTKSRAGWVPPETRTLIPASPPETLPVVSAASAATLARILHGSDTSLLLEWAALATSHAQRVPDVLVPAMLDWCVRHPKSSQHLWPVMGARAAWLSSQNPAWKARSVPATLPDAPDELWQTGSPHERLDLLTAVRHTDPALAERLLRLTWQQDSASERPRFVEKLKIRLSMKDEPFLEWTLDDRSKQVRDAASTLLASLPESSLALRMLDRAAAMFTSNPVKKGILRRTATEITIEPPKAWDPDWVRDGLEEQPRIKMGKRAWWMLQILSRTPPGALATRLGHSPEQLLEALEGSEYATHALEGILTSAASYQDHAWCALLIRHRMKISNAAASEIAPLLTPLSTEEREATLLEVLRRGQISWNEKLELLARLDHPWSASFAAASLPILDAKKTIKPTDVWSVVPQLDAIARAIAPDGLDTFERMIGTWCNDTPPPSIRTCIDRIRLRAEMHKEFQS